MPSDQLKIVVDMLRNAPAVAGADVLAMRKNMEAVVAAVPPPEGATVTQVEANGVPAEWTVADGARDDVAIVYFHGGGYVMGSLEHPPRPLRTPLARGARARAERGLPARPRASASGRSRGRRRRRALRARERLRARAHRGRGRLRGRRPHARDARRAARRRRPALRPPASASRRGPTSPSRATRSRRRPRRIRWSARPTSRSWPTPISRDGMRRRRSRPRSTRTSTGLPPLLLQVGSAEILLDDAVRVAERARDAGVEVELRVWPDMIHVWHAFADILPEGQRGRGRDGGLLREAPRLTSSSPPSACAARLGVLYLRARRSRRAARRSRARARAPLDARPRDHLPEPRLLRRVPAARARGAAGAARPARARARALLQPRGAGAARRRAQGAGAVPERSGRGARLRAQRDDGDQLRAALGAARGGLRAARDRPRVQRDAQHPRVRRRRARLPRRGGAGAVPDLGSRGGDRGGALARHCAHAARRARPRHEPDRAGVPDRRARARARGPRRRRARRRRARAGDGRRRHRRARARLLRRELPQVALRAQGRGLPLGARGPPPRRATRRDQPRRERAGARRAALRRGVLLDGHRRLHARARAARGAALPRRALAGRASRRCARATARSRSRAAGSSPMRSACRCPAPTR